jgi:hypothetical protein
MVPTSNVPTTCELHQLIILVSKQSQCLLLHQQIVTMCEKTKKHVVCANANCSNVKKTPTFSYNLGHNKRLWKVDGATIYSLCNLNSYMMKT